ncbi:MAG: cation diffusion facilitator family transporter [Bacteroidota bacterium]
MTHQHTHQHTSVKRVTKALVFGIVLNALFVIIEAGAGLYTHSLSLLTDAGHNLSDVASLALTLLANQLAQKKPNRYFSFGYSQSTVLVSLFNAGILIFALGAIAYEAVTRIGHPRTIEGGWVAAVAGIGIVINGLTAMMFFRDQKKDINVKAAYLHLLSDALISLGVVIAGIVIIYTGWNWLDAVVSLLIVIIILYGTWGLLKESLRLTLNGVPAGIDLEEVKSYLTKLQGVTDVHDLHIWAVSTTETALTVHLVIPGEAPDDLIYSRITDDLHHRFNIGHSTIQIEKAKGAFHCEQKC